MNNFDTLKLIKPMMHGSAVKRLQEMGDLLGFDYGKNDGIFGKNTKRVVQDIQREFHLKTDGICGPKTWRTIIKQADKLPERFSASIKNGMHDIRGEHKPPKLYAGKRNAEDITGIVLHQTGCNMPVKSMKWKRINAHIGITQEGIPIICNDPLDFIWHAQGLSQNCIGIEIEGNYFGIEEQENTLWRGGGGPHNLNDKMLLALDSVFCWLVEWFIKSGASWTEIHAHRQSHKSRIADPGEQIWKTIALPWIKRIEASDGGSHFSKGSGRAIPFIWNNLYLGNEYWT